MSDDIDTMMTRASLLTALSVLHYAVLLIMTVVLWRKNYNEDRKLLWTLVLWTIPIVGLVMCCFKVFKPEEQPDPLRPYDPK